MKNYHWYLFDADGTLFDTTELIYRCFLYSCRTFAGREISRKEVVGNIGLPLRNQFEQYFGPLSAQRYDVMQKEHMRYQLAIYKQYLRAFPGVVEALQTLSAGGKRLAVVTSRKIRTLRLYLRETRMHDYFDVLVTPDETERHKPEAEPALKAMEMIGAEADRTLLVGDSVYDIQCGHNAGIDTAFVSWSHNRIDDLAVKPTFVIDSMQELCV